MERRTMTFRWAMPWAGQGLLLLVWLTLGMGMAHAATTTTVTYVYTNAQGTPLAEADAQGNIIARYSYRPYGTQQTGPTNKGPGYTGHVHDPDTGLVYMQQRYYDPTIGRFLSPDPVAPKPGNIFNFGRYTYANNNPIVNIDPTGMICFRSDGHGHCVIKPSCDATCKRERQQAQENQRVRAYGGEVSSRKPSRMVVLYERTKDKGSYDIYYYQVSDANGKALTGDGYSVEEHINDTGEHASNDITSEGEFVSAQNGIMLDFVGFKVTPPPKYKERSIIYQTFTVKYKGKKYPTTTKLKHVISVHFGVVKTTTTVVIP